MARRLLLGHVHFGLALLHADVYMARQLLVDYVHFSVALLHADVLTAKKHYYFANET